LGLGYMLVGIEDIPKTAEVGVPDTERTEYVRTGSFGYQDMVGKISYQVSQTRTLHFGVSASYFAKTFDTIKGQGFNADVGVLFTSDVLSVSIGIKNVISSLKVNYTDSAVPTYNGEEDLPLESVYAMRYNFGDFTLFGQMKTKSKDRRIIKSAAVNYNPSFLPILHVSAAYKEFPSNFSNEGEFSKDVDSNIAGGIGLELFGLNVDYAYEQSKHVLFNHKHYFSVGLNF
jgi:hypothetical protein